MTTRGYWHFNSDNKYQPVKLAALLVSFCRRGSKHLKGVTFLDIGGKVWVIGHTQGPSLVLSTPTSLSTEGRRAGKVTNINIFERNHLLKNILVVWPIL